MPVKSVSQKKRKPKGYGPKKRGSKLLRCGAKRQVAAFAGTRVYLLSLLDHLRKYPALEVQGF